MRYEKVLYNLWRITKRRGDPLSGPLAERSRGSNNNNKTRSQGSDDGVAREKDKLRRRTGRREKESFQRHLGEIFHRVMESSRQRERERNKSPSLLFFFLLLKWWQLFSLPLYFQIEGGNKGQRDENLIHGPARSIPSAPSFFDWERWETTPSFSYVVVTPVISQRHCCVYDMTGRSRCWKKANDDTERVFEEAWHDSERIRRGRNDVDECETVWKKNKQTPREHCR